MGQAKLRGTFEERKAQAIAAGRIFKALTKCEMRDLRVKLMNKFLSNADRENLIYNAHLRSRKES